MKKRTCFSGVETNKTILSTERNSLMH